MNAYRSSIDVPSVINVVGLIGFCQNQQGKEWKTDRKVRGGDKKAGRPRASSGTFLGNINGIATFAHPPYG